MYLYVLKAFRYLENLADLFFLLSRHKFSSIACVTVANFNAEKRKKKKPKIRKARCFEYKYNITTKSTLFFAAFTLLTSFIFTRCSFEETQTVATFNQIVTQDEFDIDGAPNSTIWDYDLGTGPNNDGWGNQELQNYTNRSENAIVQNGFLIMTANRESLDGANYTSSRLVTRGLVEQKYGRFEARIKIPFGKGVWPAFWLLGANCGQGTNGTELWPGCGEIDIMENFGRNPTETSGSVHGPGYSGATPITKKYNLENDRLDAGFHIYGIEWTPDYINYYVDGDLYNQITREDVEKEGAWVFDQPFYIIINIAVGGQAVDSPVNTAFPKRMLVDYVRVYKN